MSRTDKDQPDWVKALYADQDGRATEVYHSIHCVDYVNRFTGAGPAEAVSKRVPREVAETNGWDVSDYWANTPGPTVYATIPQAPHACNVDAPTGNCRRYIAADGRRVLCSCCAPPANPRRRAVTRDWLRDVAKEYRGSGGFDEDPDWEPTVRGIDEAKTPWQGRYVRAR